MKAPGTTTVVDVAKAGARHTLMRLMAFLALFGALQACHGNPEARLPAPDPAQEAPSHAQWDSLLQAHVSADGLVDYAGFLQDRHRLQAYLDHLSGYIPGQHWSREETLAYYINLYNAGTVALILEHYPVGSIKDIRSPWGKRRLKLGDATLSLDDVEHGILRKMGEPRIHFALNCASFSCPKLRPEAYFADRLEAQLEAAARDFINDPLRNRAAGGRPELSRIFKWYGADFTQGGGTLTGFLNRYLKTPLPEGTTLRYLPYDWSLNDIR
ncbi:DUF547 domain-containing protein [Robiginitalea sp. M366]|uniref:DUF547 domain-containing protein n=1 Tax=Robiginitalea aestuariiviva TaxID=3036903 RepID=UPI00240D7AEC|nr:DUF547 domain-containing protein [Robiginitalea aestuariiviva]MDG1571854.1 DUF547 domain-containing protein [Robiginitalea aestuariiviva]